MSNDDYLDERVSAWIDGLLGPEEARELEEELRRAGRFEELRKLSGTVDLVRNLPPETPPSELPERIMAAVAAEESPLPVGGFRRVLPWVLSAATAAAAAWLLILTLPEKVTPKKGDMDGLLELTQESIPKKTKEQQEKEPEAVLKEMEQPEEAADELRDRKEGFLKKQLGPAKGTKPSGKPRLVMDAAKDKAKLLPLPATKAKKAGGEKLKMDKKLAGRLGAAKEEAKSMGSRAGSKKRSRPTPAKKTETPPAPVNPKVMARGPGARRGRRGDTPEPSTPAVPSSLPTSPSPKGGKGEMARGGAALTGKKKQPSPEGMRRKGWGNKIGSPAPESAKPKEKGKSRKAESKGPKLVKKQGPEKHEKSPPKDPLVTQKVFFFYVAKATDLEFKEFAKVGGKVGRKPMAADHILGGPKALPPGQAYWFRLTGKQEEVFAALGRIKSITPREQYLIGLPPTPAKAGFFFDILVVIKD